MTYDSKENRDFQEELLRVKPKSSGKADIDDTYGPFFTSQRWILVYNGLFLGILLYVYRVNISIAIVSMATDPIKATGDDVTLGGNVSVHIDQSNDTNKVDTNWTYVYETDRQVDQGRCRKLGAGPTNAQDNHAEFEWDTRLQSFVLSSYFYGHMASQIAGGWLSGRYGGKHVIGISMAISSAVSLLSPLLARFSVYALIAARVVTGVCGTGQGEVIFSFVWFPNFADFKAKVWQGLTMASSTGAILTSWFSLAGVWALPTERSRFTAIFWFGQITGTVVGYTTSGFLCAQGFDNGWGSVFYVHGIAGAVFVAVWWYSVHNSPEEHPRVTDVEKRLLSDHLRFDAKEKRKNIRVPWLSIVTSPGVMAVVITNFADTWLIFVLLTCLPLFMSEVLNFEIKSNGFISSLPFMTMCMGLAVSGVMADFISSRRWLGTTSIRKLFQVTGNIGMAAFVVGSGFISCERRELVILCLCLCTFMEGIGVAPGYPCNPIDMAPSHAAVIYGMSSTIASIPGIVAPVVVAELTTHQTSEEWRRVFYICAGLALFAALIYGVFSTSELAPWSGDGRFEINIPEKSEATYSSEKSAQSNEKLKMIPSDIPLVSCDRTHNCDNDKWENDPVFIGSTNSV